MTLKYHVMFQIMIILKFNKLIFMEKKKKKKTQS